VASRLIYGIDDVPPLRESLFLGFQHYLTMFGSTVAIPLILSEPLGMAGDPVAVGWLIGTMFFVSGITTLLQTTWGNRLPLVQGGTFSFLTPAITICGMAVVADAGWEVRLRHVQGAVIVGSLFEMAVGFSGLVGRVLRFVSPLTIAPTIALIGLSLFKFGAPVAGTHWGIGGLTIGQMITYVAVSWIGRSFYFNNIARDLSRMIIDGEISYLHGKRRLSALNRKDYLRLLREKNTLLARDKELEGKGEEREREKIRERVGELMSAMPDCMQWSTPCIHPFALVLAGDVLFAGGEGEVAAFGTADGRMLWNAETRGRAYGLAAANGCLFVSTDQGAIHCFTEEGR